MTYLSQHEVDQLPIGTKVLVTWSGGNGPHEYVIVRHLGITQAVLENGLYVGPLDSVGNQQPATMVSINERHG